VGTVTNEAEEKATKGDLLEALRTAFNTSTANVALDSIEAVDMHFERPAVGSLADALYVQLMSMLKTETPSGFDTHDLRSLAAAFALERAVGVSDQSYDDIIAAVLPCLPAGTELKLPADPCWVDVASIGRALVTLGVYRDTDERHEAVAAAAARLIGKGFRVTLVNGRVDRRGPAIAEITSAVSNHLDRLGLMNVLGNLLRTARSVGVYEFDQYLFGRRYTPGRPREPSIPFGFLLNLAVRVPDRPLASDRPDVDWRAAIELARDLAAVIDVEPYNQFWMINSAPKRLEPLLNEVGLYDHLFGFRQWCIFVTPLLLRSFFGTAHDAALLAKFGWCVTDAVRLAEAFIRHIRTDPVRLTRGDLMSTGLNSDTLDQMLPHFAHAKGKVNASYASPIAARRADLMFRPLIEGEEGTYIAPAASTVGPACYEVVAAALRETLATGDMSNLVGKGTERAVSGLLHFHGLTPSFESAKYNEGKTVDSGECDLVLEDDDNILFIECKAKPLTRATMEGEPGAALLDYAGGVIESQTQALQHERLLHDNSEIVFDDGRRLQLRGRRVTRFSVTLLDHGSLQDRFLFMNLVKPLLRWQVTFDPTSPSKKRYEDLNKQLDKHQREMKAAERRSKSAWQETLGVASLSFGQLAVILVENPTLARLIEVLRKPVTHGSMNPLLEYHYIKPHIKPRSVD
jgi:hypothetical protein